MFRSHNAQPTTAHDEPLEFAWNPETGDLRGKSAAIVADMCRQAVREGWVTGHPHPTGCAIADPLRRPAEMAVVLGQIWTLNVELAAMYPEIDDDIQVGSEDSPAVE